MDAISIDAKARETGKKAAKAARREGNVPAVVYGHGVEPVSIQVPELSLHQLIYTTELHKVDISVDGKAYNCIVKEVDFHPVTDRPIHVDFQVLQESEPVKVNVPVRFSGTAIGQRNGGQTKFVSKTLDVICLPKDLPSSIDVDISDLKIGDAVRVRDLGLEALTFLAGDSRTIVHVNRPKGGLLGEEGEGEEGEEGDGKAGEGEEATAEADA